MISWALAFWLWLAILLFFSVRGAVFFIFLIFKAAISPYELFPQLLSSLFRAFICQPSFSSPTIIEVVFPFQLFPSTASIFISFLAQLFIFTVFLSLIYLFFTSLFWLFILPLFSSFLLFLLRFYPILLCVIFIFVLSVLSLSSLSRVSVFILPFCVLLIFFCLQLLFLCVTFLFYLFHPYPSFIFIFVTIIFFSLITIAALFPSVIFIAFSSLIPFFFIQLPSAICLSFISTALAAHPLFCEPTFIFLIFIVSVSTTLIFVSFLSEGDLAPLFLSFA